MITRDYALTMARYNLWQNESLMTAASTLTPEERAKDRGAFFGSIEKTFNHLLWADRAWLSRIAGAPAPTGGNTEFDGDWSDFRDTRAATDRKLLDWAKAAPPEWFAGDLTWYSGMLGRDFTRPRAEVIVHLFNHQTHHRGQIHAMLTAAGTKPEATDVITLPERYQAF